MSVLSQLFVEKLFPAKKIFFGAKTAGVGEKNWPPAGVQRTKRRPAVSRRCVTLQESQAPQLEKLAICRFVCSPTAIIAREGPKKVIAG